MQLFPQGTRAAFASAPFGPNEAPNITPSRAWRTFQTGAGEGVADARCASRQIARRLRPIYPGAAARNTTTAGEIC